MFSCVKNLLEFLFLPVLLLSSCLWYCLSYSEEKIVLDREKRILVPGSCPVFSKALWMAASFSLWYKAQRDNCSVLLHCPSGMCIVILTLYLHPCRWWWVRLWTPWRQHFLALNPRAPQRSWVKPRMKASPRQKARRPASESPSVVQGPCPQVSKPHSILKP